MFKTQLTEDKIQKRLSSFFAPNSVKYDIDNLYVFFWESDKLLETKTGYIYEFEIKISRSDFKADFKKKEKHLIIEGKEKYMPSFQNYYGRFKSQCPTIEDWEKMCEERYPYHLTKYYKRPNYFYYAVPEGMINKDDVPEYAGLIHIGEEYGFKIIKKAPCLHKEKYNDIDLDLGKKFYYNMLKWKERTSEWKNQYDKVNTQLNEELTISGHEKTYSELKEELNTTLKKLEREREDKEKILKGYRYKIEDARYLTFVNRKLKNTIKKLDTDFDASKFNEEAEKEYDNIYGGRQL